jgi:hypothetical protein
VAAPSLLLLGGGRRLSVARGELDGALRLSLDRELFSGARVVSGAPLQLSAFALESGELVLCARQSAEAARELQLDLGPTKELRKRLDAAEVEQLAELVRAVGGRQSTVG